jgi:thioredoxin reductase (NADPH)
MLNKPVILLVDDDPQVLAAVRRDLRTKFRDYALVSASSGEQAVSTINELKSRGDALALVISDQRMPGLQGTDVLSRSLETYPQAGRVLLTAYSDVEAAIRAINEAHLDHYLAKPWEPPEERLFPVVEELLDRWQAESLPETSGLRLVGHQWDRLSHTVKDYLAGNLIPYKWVDFGRDAEARVLLESKGLTEQELPVLFFEDGSVQSRPEPRDVAERLGRPLSGKYELYDLVIVGAGPAGLAAAVYGASEGLRTLLLDEHAPGGQAGTSSRIENYLGFPSGVSGRDLTARALQQAQRLGAEFLSPLGVVDACLEGGYTRLTLANGRNLVSRTMLAATGMAYREHTATGCQELTGRGVYYGAAATEARACAGTRVLVIGGGNSAGQAAMYLSSYAKEVEIVIRRDSLKATMSQYLIDQLGKTPNVRIRPWTEVEAMEGGEHLERVVLRSVETGESSVEPAGAVFIFIGTRPRTEWLPPSVLRDSKGFIITDRDLLPLEPFVRLWKEGREPLAFETSVRGVFAAGDLRAGAMNRVASAVGEGSMVVRSVHEYLALT